MRTPAALQKILATDISDLVNMVHGVTGYGQRARLTQFEDATNYANEFGNKDTTNGRAVKIQYGDPGGSPVTLATFQKSASAIQSNDGTKSISVSNTGVNVTGGFSISGQTVGAGVVVYNVLDYGIAKASNATSSALAAANTTALQAMVAAVAVDGLVSGTIFFPPGHYAFNAPVVLDTALGYSEGLNIQGCGEATNIHIYDSTRAANGWVFGSATSALIRCHIADLCFYQESAATGGATVAITRGTYMYFDRVNVFGGANGTGSPFYCMQIGTSTSAVNNIYLSNCNMVCGDVANSAVIACKGNHVALGGLSINGCSLQGGNAVASTNSIGILISTTATAGVDFDSMWLANSGVGHCKYGLYVAGCNAANFLVQNTYFDGCGTYDVLLQASAGVAVGNMQFSNCWMAVNEHGAINVELDPNGGTLAGVQIDNCLMTVGSTMLGASAVSGGCVLVKAGTSDVTITNSRMGSSATSGINTVDVATSCSNIVIANNIIYSSASSAAGIAIQTSASPVVVQGNILRVKNVTFNGTTSTARIYTATTNAFLA